jgi:hypothetical protein
VPDDLNEIASVPNSAQNANHDNAPAPGPNHVENIQVGFVRSILPEIDPVMLHKLKQPLTSFLSHSVSEKQAMQTSSPDPFSFESFDWANSEHANNSTIPSPTTLRMWAKYFSTKDLGLSFVTIPTEWMDFFTLMLLKDVSNE